jgi:protease-4
MSKFLKNILSSCLGVMLAFFILGFGLMIFGASLSSGKTISKDSVLELDFSSFIPEKTGNVEADPFTFQPGANIGLRRINQLIDHAAKDEKIKGIYLKNAGFGGGQASLISIREHLNAFKSSGKFIYAYGDFYSQSSYLLASVADSIFLNPQGTVDIKGYAVMIPFFKELMDEVGVEANIFYAGNFKSATEPFRRNDMSEPNKLQTRQYLNGMYDIYASLIEEGRGISRNELDIIASELRGRNAKLSLENKLIDRIAYVTEVEDIIKKKIGLSDRRKLKSVSLEDYHSFASIEEEKNKDNKIAIVYAEGNVVYGSNDKGVISEEKLLETLGRIKNKKSIKAVVLRVNSGGGSALTSDIIHHEMQALKDAGKKVIASFGDVAASGGYYIAANADTIVCAPNTITGSIGVFSMFPNMRELVSDKLKMNFDTLKTHPLAINLSSFYDLSEREKELMQEGTDDVYTRFCEIVGEGRSLPIDQVREIAQGRVYTGLAAKEIGLVDEIGFLEDAIEIAASSAGLSAYQVVEYPEIKPDPLEEIINGIMSGTNAEVKLPMNKETRLMLNYYREWYPILQYSDPQAKMPFVLQMD